MILDTRISPEYLAIQCAMHANGDYGKSGGKWWRKVQELTYRYRCSTVLDYGSGTGKLTRNLIKLGIKASCYDPAVPGDSLEPETPFDLVTCIDVLEHIEPDKIHAVLAHLRELTSRRLFVVISTRFAGKVLSDGRNAHLIVRPAEWWKNLLVSEGFVVEQEEHTIPGKEWTATLSIFRR